jgi:hypothetical protein
MTFLRPLTTACLALTVVASHARAQAPTSATADLSLATIVARQAAGGPGDSLSSEFPLGLVVAQYATPGWPRRLLRAWQVAPTDRRTLIELSPDSVPSGAPRVHFSVDSVVGNQFFVSVEVLNRCSSEEERVILRTSPGGWIVTKVEPTLEGAGNCVSPRDVEPPAA